MIYTYAAVAIASALLAGTATWKVQNWRHDSAELARQQAAERETLRRTDKIDTSAVKHEQAKARIETEFLVITEKVNEITQQPFYRDDPLCLDDSGLRELTNAVRPAKTASKPAD